jgi:hypothetical protein
MRVLAIAVALLLSLAACGGDDKPAAESIGTETPAETSESSPSPTTPIMGNWQRVTTCDERVAALEEAGLGEFAIEHAAGEGWIPGVTSPDQIKDPEHPCKGAIPLKHGHFFTEDGLFGSTDDQGDQVDDGTYSVIDQDTIVIEKEFGNVTFNYRIQDDGTLLLDPVMPKCTKNGCFAAQWAAAVAYPGLPWQPRV